jgi:hypothetical protein
MCGHRGTKDLGFMIINPCATPLHGLVLMHQSCPYWEKGFDALHVQHWGKFGPCTPGEDNRNIASYEGQGRGCQNQAGTFVIYSFDFVGGNFRLKCKISELSTKVTDFDLINKILALDETKEIFDVRQLDGKSYESWT